jgi:hypothetical protein
VIDLPELCGVPIGYHSAGPQANDPICELSREFHLVETDEHRDHALSRNVSKNGQDTLGGLWVKTGYRFVGQNKSALLSERSRDRYALLLAARQAIGALQRV